MLTRRQFIQTSSVVGAGLLVPELGHARRRFVHDPEREMALLDPLTQPQFVSLLPAPARIDATAGGTHWIRMTQFKQLLGLVDPRNGRPFRTRVWGYHGTYPGPTLMAQKGVPVEIRWDNRLPGKHLLPVDETVHLARPARGGVPTVTHLHGGHTESASDGLPEAWFTRHFKEVGAHFVKETYRYDNDQEAATLWYHDHALGITRLNVYAGLAGFYLLRDANENQLIAEGVLPSGPYEREIVIQDRMFDVQGQLFYPAFVDDPGGDELPEEAPQPSVIAEFFGNFILVNGMAWPKLEVEPRKYRLRLLNGSDSRFYVLEFRDDQFNGTPQAFYQIGTDEGLLPLPVPLTRLLLGPGERADLLVDFAGWSEGAELFLRNFGPDGPFKGVNLDGTLASGDLDDPTPFPPADPATTGQIMQFVVNQPFNTAVAEATMDAGTPLRPEITPLVQTGPTRQLVLFEGEDEFGRLQPLLGTLVEGSLSWFEPLTEHPDLNAVEVWEVYNATEDAHPIHLHLVAFQIMNRQSFTGTLLAKNQPQHNGSVGVGGILSGVMLVGDAENPAPNEAGWKDTAVMPPGKVTRIKARFDRPGRYVWHCHILSHEDHEMMRPYHVG